MWLFKYGVPILAILGFGHGCYEAFTSTPEHNEKMGIARNAARMFGVCNLFMAVSWAVILVTIGGGVTWQRTLAVFITGMFMFDYVVSLALYKNAGDNFFKYWAGAAAILSILYILWL